MTTKSAVNTRELRATEQSTKKTCVYAHAHHKNIIERGVRSDYVRVCVVYTKAVIKYVYTLPLISL